MDVGLCLSFSRVLGRSFGSCQVGFNFPTNDQASSQAKRGRAKFRRAWRKWVLDARGPRSPAAPPRSPGARISSGTHGLPRSLDHGAKSCQCEDRAYPGMSLCHRKGDSSEVIELKVFLPERLSFIKSLTGGGTHLSDTVGLA